MSLGSADDDRQWDSTAVYENASLGSFFFPDLWDLAPPPQLPVVPCSLNHQYFAISRRFLPSHRTRQGLLSKVFQIIRQPAIQENIGGAHLRCQNALWAQLSIVFPCAIRIQCLQAPFLEELASFLLRGRVYTSVSGSSVSWVCMAQPFPKIHQKYPMNTAVSTRFHPCTKYDKCQPQCQYYLWISSYYYGHKLSFWKTINTIVQICLIISAPSSAIAGLFFWQFPMGKCIWQILLSFTAIIAVLHPVFKISEHNQDYEKTLQGYRIVGHQLDKIQMLITQDRCYSEKHRTLLEVANEMIGKLKENDPDSEVNDKIRKICQNKVEEELPVESFYIPKEE